MRSDPTPDAACKNLSFLTPPMSAEDEFADRDAQGLQPRKKDGPKDDDAAMAKAQVRRLGRWRWHWHWR